MNYRINALTIGLALLLGSCGVASTGNAPSASPDASPTSPSEVISPEANPSPEASPEPESSNPAPDESVTDAEPYPEIGTLISAEAGDLKCYAAVRDRQGQVFDIGATFDMCDRPELLNQTLRLIYSEENVADCQSAEPCGRSRRETLISDAVLLGQDWQVLSNGTWTVTVGRIETWDGVNNSGHLTYYGCDPDGNCLALDEGFVVCRHGVCNRSWANGDYAYTLSTKLTETGDDPTTLLVWENGTEILRAEHMELVNSSDF